MGCYEEIYCFENTLIHLPMIIMIITTMNHNIINVFMSTLHLWGLAIQQMYLAIHMHTHHLSANLIFYS